jgi:hypothetical protein
MGVIYGIISQEVSLNFNNRKGKRIMAEPKSLIRSETIEKKIYLLRGQKVMLSIDLAGLYQVEPRVLIQAVKRNIDRFPGDFMVQLTWKEVAFLKSQSAISNDPPARASKSQIVILKRGLNVKYPPYAFTEQGVAMLSSVLRSKRAIQWPKWGRSGKYSLLQNGGRSGKYSLLIFNDWLSELR